MPKLVNRKKRVVEKMMKDMLFAATSEILIEKGWLGLTMERVAESAGVSKGTVYNYFRDKKELVLFVVSRLASDMEDRLAAIIDKSHSSQDALRRIIREELKYRKDRSNLAIAFINAFNEEAELREKFSENENPFRGVEEKLVQLFKKGIRDREFRPVNPESMVVVLRSILMGISRNWSYGSLEKTDEDMADFVIYLLENGMFAIGEDKR